MATACMQEDDRSNTGSPSCGYRDQLEAGDGQAGHDGVAERLVVPWKPGNAGGGKGPQFRTDVKSEDVQEIGQPINSAKRSRIADDVTCEGMKFCPRAGCVKCARPVRRAGCGNGAASYRATSRLYASQTSALHMVSAWSVENELVLGQIRTAAKSNEITAIPLLIAMLDLEGAIVTIDAMGCQKDIAQSIQNAGADYVLALKGNQGNTLESAKFIFEWEEKNGFHGVFYTQYETMDKDHGRIETRKAYSIDVTGMEEFKEWPGLESVTKIISIREIIGQGTTEEIRYYLSSLPADAEKIGPAVRSHWGIENSLHWILDVNFQEDRARNRKDHSAENMAILRHMVLNLIKKERSSKTSVRGKRLKASWSDDYLLTLLS